MRAVAQFGLTGQASPRTAFQHGPSQFGARQRFGGGMPQGHSQAMRPHMMYQPEDEDEEPPEVMIEGSDGPAKVVMS